MDRADAHAEPFGGLLLPHVSRHRLDRLGPCLQWDDGFGHMAGIPGILCQPAFQALPPGRVSQVLHDLGRGHRRGGIQVHRALSFLGAEHTIILSFSLQENVRTCYDGSSRSTYIQLRKSIKLNCFRTRMSIHLEKIKSKFLSHLAPIFSGHCSPGQQ